MKNSVSRWAARRPNDSTTLTDSVYDIKQLCLEQTVARTHSNYVAHAFGKARSKQVGANSVEFAPLDTHS